MSPENDSLNPYRSPEATQEYVAAQDAPVILDFARRKRRQLGLLLAVMAIWGFLSGFLAEDSAGIRVIDLASGLIVAILILRWCEIDREERQLSRWRYFVPLMVLCPGPLILMPTYFFVTRGIGGFAATAKACAFVVLMIVVACTAWGMALLLTSAEL
jgi:hypothetical protein